MEKKNPEEKTQRLIPLYSKQLFFFFLIVSGNYISEIFSCHIQQQFTNNRTVKHILGLMTMYFFVTFVDEKHFIKPLWAVFTAIFLYIWFILISVTSHNYTLIIIGLLFLIYVSNNVINHNILEETDENKIKKIKRHKRNIQLLLFIVAILLTLYGTIVYIGQKKLEYGKKFNYSTFFLGTPNCKYNGLGREKSLDDLAYIKIALN